MPPVSPLPPSRESYPEVFAHNSVAAKNIRTNITEAEYTELLKDTRPDIEHPLVREVLGRPTLFFGQVDTSFLVESAAANPAMVEYD
eukprot:SAG11_NODE_17805_length_508_cov_1.127139_2_plen_86_part_01